MDKIHPFEAYFVNEWRRSYVDWLWYPAIHPLEGWILVISYGRLINFIQLTGELPNEICTVEHPQRRPDGQSEQILTFGTHAYCSLNILGEFFEILSIHESQIFKNIYQALLAIFKGPLVMCFGSYNGPICWSGCVIQYIYNKIYRSPSSYALAHLIYIERYGSMMAELMATHVSLRVCLQILMQKV